MGGSGRREDTPRFAAALALGQFGRARPVAFRFGAILRRLSGCENSIPSAVAQVSVGILRNMVLARQAMRRLTWLALIAMLGLALAPTVSRALSVLGSSAGHVHGAAAIVEATAGHADCDDSAAASDDPSAQRSGAALPTLDQQGGHAGQGHGAAGEHDHFNHCPLCGVAATAWTVAPAVSTWGVDPQGADGHSRQAGDAAPLPSTAWPAHQPRGPPSRA